MKAAVTGGAGFIGHHLVRTLRERGDDVVVIDDFSSGRRERLAHVSERVRIVEGSVTDPRALDSAFAGCDVVFHHAALVSVPESMLHPQRAMDINEGGTIEVVLAAARNGVNRVVFAGSSAVYGECDPLPCLEDQPTRPRSPYGVSKLAAESYLHSLGEGHAVNTVVLRYFNVFGPGQDPASPYAAVVPRFITAILAGAPPVINGSGAITRDFIHVDDVVRANLLASNPKAPSGVTCNIASGRPTTLLELVAAVNAAAMSDVDAEYGPPRPGDIVHSHASVAMAAGVLGFEASISLKQGIARTIDAARLRATENAPAGSPAAARATRRERQRGHRSRP